MAEDIHGLATVVVRSRDGELLVDESVPVQARRITSLGTARLELEGVPVEVDIILQPSASMTATPDRLARLARAVEEMRDDDDPDWQELASAFNAIL